MTDPSDALASFQLYLTNGSPRLQPGTFDKTLLAHLDYPNGHMRLTYVRLAQHTVTVFVEFVQIEPLDGLACFHVGYAVPPAYRGQGLARAALDAALKELEFGLGRNGVPAFYVEAVIGTDNTASRRVAEQVLTQSPEAITDSVSGQPALRYLRRVGGADVYAPPNGSHRKTY